jgi:DNA invertase Pin-like site-specific DNA recombinase
MSDITKISTSHLSRAAYVYLRQSSAAQVQHNRESTQRQYALVTKASMLGWPAQQIVVIDEDLGLSGAGIVERSGFARLTAEVALGHVGIVLGLEVSRLARNNADWYRLLDLCGLTDTLIGDADGVYHPAMFNDRLLLGLKGTMSEAELHVLRARLNGGIRNKAARGELRRGLPVGFVWGEEDGEVRFHPDQAVCTAIRTVFDRFDELGSVRRVWLWLRSEGLSFPLQTRYGGSIRWVDPSYIAVYHVLTNPSMRAPTPMARAATRSRSIAAVRARSGCVGCRNRNGLCSSQTTIKASSTGAPMRQIGLASAPIRILVPINRAAVP